MADIVIMDVTITPNPVKAKEAYTISADIRDKIYVLDTGDGSILAGSDGSVLETG